MDIHLAPGISLIHSHASFRLATGIVLSFLLACTPDGASDLEIVRRDSAGIVIVENILSAPIETGGWAISEGPVLSIGTVEGEDPYQLYGVAGAHRLEDGRIAVVNAGSREVRIFDANGIHLAIFGRPGAGPEEFEAPVLAGAIADTLLVLDRAHHRIAYLHPDLGFVRLVRVSDSVGGYLNPSGTFSNGQVVFGGAFDMRRIGELRNGMNRAHTFYRSSNPDGSMGTDFGDKLGAEFFIRDLEGSGQDSRPALIPFGKAPVATVSPNYFFFSDMGGWEVDVFLPTGDPVRSIRTNREPVAVTARDGELNIENVIAGVGDPEQETQIRQYLGSLPLPGHFPPFGNLMADVRDHLWVQDFQRPGAENRAWTIFDEAGGLAGRVTLPERFNPFEIGEDYLLGVGWDEMQVEYVRMYHLFRSSGS
jgi:hypothetical protein